MSRSRRLLCSLVVVAAIMPATTARADGIIVERLYLPMGDGVRLAVTVARPDVAGGRFPVLLNYDPYGAGSVTESFGQPMAGFFVPRGYAFVTASIRGTGCSGGEYDQVFSQIEARDGAQLVEWAASREWSTGAVGMTGASYPGIDQFFVAAQRPAGLKAIAPFETLSDIYRDVTYPGGVFNPVFSEGWTLGLQPGLSAFGPAADLPKSDVECAANVAHQAAHNWRGNAGAYIATHPLDDQFYETRSPKSVVSQIDVPVFMANAWQDHQVGSRGTSLYDMIRTPKKLTVTNGLHNTPRTAPVIREQLGRWFDYWLKGDVSNGIMSEPPVTVLLETDETTFEPSTVLRYASWPPADTFASLYLRDAGRLASDAPPGEELPDAYVFPGAASQSKTAHDGVPPVGSPSYTTAPLQSDVLLIGPAELELFAATTNLDTDWFVSLSEVRPDGNISYVTKGMLRASHKPLDEGRSKPGRPYHLHTNAVLVNPGEVVSYRVEFLPFGHAFRKDSSIRLDFLTPSVLAEPYWGYASQPLPAINLVHHSAGMASRLVLPSVSSPELPPAPKCGTVIGQPCGLDPNNP